MGDPITVRRVYTHTKAATDRYFKLLFFFNLNLNYKSLNLHS